MNNEMGFQWKWWGTKSTEKTNVWKNSCWDNAKLQKVLRQRSVWYYPFTKHTVTNRILYKERLRFGFSLMWRGAWRRTCDLGVIWAGLMCSCRGAGVLHPCAPPMWPHGGLREQRTTRGKRTMKAKQRVEDTRNEWTAVQAETWLQSSGATNGQSRPPALVGKHRTCCF